jgi:hypothetical protein
MGGGLSYILPIPMKLQSSYPSQDSPWSRKTKLVQNIQPIKVLKI